MEPSLVLAPGKLSTRYHVSTAIFGIIATPTLIANILLLFIVYRGTNFRDLSTMLVSFVSIADVIYVVYTCVYIVVQYVLDDVSDIAGTIVITLQSVLRMAPTMTFIIVAYNWYLAKFKPVFCYKFHQIPNISIKCFLLSWAATFGACVGVPFVVCDRFQKIQFLAYSVSSFALQLIALVVEIILHGKNLLRTNQEIANCTKTNTMLSFNLKITKVFLFLSTVYFASIAPILLYPFFDIQLGLPSSHFNIFVYHLVSCFPCLLNPISLYFISQKFQDELRCLFGMSKAIKGQNEPNPIVPEAFSANRGFFEPRTPTWRQSNEYWNRELIYGEYPSGAPLKETPKKKENGKKKDVRFCDIVEEVEPHSPAPGSSRTIGSDLGLLTISNETEAPKSRKLSHEPMSSVQKASEVKDTKLTQNDRSLGSHNIPHAITNALDLGTRKSKWGGSWPRSQSSPYNSFTDIDLSRHGPASLLQQNKQFKRNLIQRSRSLYQPRRIDDDVFSGSSSQSREPEDVRRTVSTTKTTTVQVQINIQDKEEVKETYL